MRLALVALGLLALVAAVYARALGHDFVFHDDFAFIAENPELRDELTLGGLTSSFEPNYYFWTPLSMISLQLNRSLLGPEPAGFLLVNALLHGLSAVLLFLALHRMTRALGASAFVAAVFVAHPYQVEVVAWASGRKDVLAGAMWMLTLLAYAHYAARPSPLRYLGVAAGVVLALLAKASAVTLPFVLLLLDYWPLARLRESPGARLPDPCRLGRALLEKLPLFALVGLVSALVYAQYAERGHMGAVYGYTLSFADRLMNALDSYVIYLAKAFWPSGLAFYYPFPVDALSPLQSAGSAALLVGITAACLGLADRRPYLLMGWLWFAGVLVPLIGLVQVFEQARADRYMYFPIVGLAIAVAWGAVDLFPRRPRLLAAAAALALAALGLAAWRQVGHWRDSDAMFARALAVTEDNFYAHHGLAFWKMRNGDLEAARTHYEEVFRLKPLWAHPRFEWANGLERSGQLQPALALYAEGMRLEPRHALGAGFFGLALVRAGRWNESRPLLEFSLGTYGDSFRLRYTAALTAEYAGDSRDAVRHYREAVRIDPSSRVAANGLAWLLATAAIEALRDPEEAVALAERAALADPPNANYLDTLAAAYAAAGRFEDAVAAAERAVRVAESAGTAPLAAQVRARLPLYRAGRPYVEGAASAPP